MSAPHPTATPAEPTRPRLLRDTQIAAMLGVSRATVWRYVAAGRLNPIKLSYGVTRFDLGEVERLITRARRGA
jgi:predicted DNA-binding transcriptional regulator AlpA